MTRFFPQPSRTLLSALLLSLFLHFLVFSGLGEVLAAWITPKTESKIISAHIVSSAAKEAAIVAEAQAETPPPPPRPKKKKKPAPLPPDPAEPYSLLPEVITVQEEAPGEMGAEEAPEHEAEIILAGDDAGGLWPDIPGQWELVQGEMESEVGLGEHSLPDGRIFPAKGEINYRVYRGEQEWEIGMARIDWELRQRTYRFATLMKTTGLIGFLYQAGVETESEGVISSGNGGVFPLRYQVKQGARANETTSFDWNGRTLRVEGGKKTKDFALRWNSQDLLSLQWQFPFWIAEKEAVREVKETDGTDADPAVNVAADVKWQGWTKTIWMATGKGYESYRIFAIGEESLELAGRVWETLHFRVSEGRVETDFWLARDLYWLPVQIRHRDRRGDLYEQRLDSYNFIREKTEELP